MPPPEGPWFDFAPWGRRVAGYILDGLLVAVVLIPLAIVFGVVTGFDALLHAGGMHRQPGAGFCCILGMLPLAGLLVGLWNKVYLVATRGASLGQGFMDIMVVDAQGRLVSQGTALLRLVAHTAMGVVPFLSAIDLLWPLWDTRRQTLHDKIAGSYVINKPLS